MFLLEKHRGMPVLLAVRFTLGGPLDKPAAAAAAAAAASGAITISLSGDSSPAGGCGGSSCCWLEAAGDSVMAGMAPTGADRAGAKWS